MKFSLLTPPTDAPSRIPLTRGVPNAAAMAVDTSGMPRSLPQATLDPDTFALPFQALAKFAAMGGKVGEDLGNIVLEAEHKKREADNLAVTTNLTHQAALEFDEGLEKKKLSTDQFTFRPEVDQLWKDVSQKYFAMAPNKEVQRELGLKLMGLKASKFPEVNNTQRQKQFAYYEASLNTASMSASQIITDPTTTPWERDFMIEDLETTYRGFARQGYPADQIVKMRERYLTNAFGTLALQEMSKDPVKFLPKSEGGEDGYRAFASDGKYPADPKYLQQLVSVTAPAAKLAAERRADEAQRRTEATFNAHLEGAWQSQFKRLLTDLYSDDPATVAAASAQVDEFVTNSGTYVKNGEVETLLRARRDTARQGGVTIPKVYDKIQLDILRDPSKVSREYILSWGGKGLAVTGERSVTQLLDKRESMLKADDISHRPDYKLGMSLIQASPLGSIAVLTTAAAFSATTKSRQLSEQADLHMDAILEFDRLARSKEWEGRPLSDLGEFVAKKYTRILFEMRGRGPSSGTTGTPGTPGGKPPASPRPVDRDNP